MNNNQGALYFGAGVDLQQWRANMAEMRRDILGLNTNTQKQTSGISTAFKTASNSASNSISGLSKNVQNETQKIDGSFKNLGLGLATYFSGAALANFTREIINIRGEFQKTEIAFGTMLKSTDKAKALMEQMVELAAKTPFSLKDVSTGAKQLLAFQVPAEQVVDTVTRLGNVAAGLSVPLSRIILVYGQVKAKNKLMGDDLRQFTEAGIPMVAELAKKFGTTTAEISKMVTAGKIGFKDVQDVLFSMTNEGGMFFNLMEKQSASLSGKMSNLGDTIDQVFNKIGAQSEGFLGGAIDEASYLIENYDTLLEVLGVAIATYGTYKAALIAFAAWQQLSAGAALQQALAQGTLTVAQSYGAAATVALQRAQIGLNAAMTANPIGIVIGLLAGLSYVIYKNVTATNAYIDLQSKLKEENDKNNTSIDEQKSKIESLTNIIKNKNTTDTQAKKALDQINKLTGNRIQGLTVEGIRLGQNTTALQGYIKMIELEARAKSLIATKVEAEKKEREIRGDNFNDLTLGDRFGNFRETKDLGLSAQQRKRKALIEDLQAVWRTKAEIDRELNKLQAQGVNIGDEIDNAALGATIAATEETKAAGKKQQNEIEKLYGIDTLKGLQQRISKFNEIMETSVFGSEKYNSAKVQKEALEARLKAMTSSFDDEIAEIKRQIEVRDKLLKSGYDKETVDAMFPQVKDQSYLQYLEKLGAELENQPGKEAAENMIKLQSVLEEYKGSETFIDNVNKQIENLKSKFSGNELIDKLEAFKKASLEGTTGDENNAKRQAVERAQTEELERQKANYEAFLKEKETFEQKKKDIDEKYNSIDAQINGSSSSADEKSRLLTESAKAKGREYSQAFLDSIKDTSMWEKAFSDIAKMTSREMKKAISDLKTQLATAKTNGATATEIKTIQDRITELQNALNTNPFEKIASSFKKLGDETLTTLEKLDVAKDLFNGLGEGVQMVGDAFGGFDEQTQDTVNSIMEIGNAAFDLGKSIASGDVAGMIQAGLKLIGSIGKALNGDKKKERNIKRQAAALKELENRYNALAFAAERAFGAQKYDGQRDLIKNLQQQKIAIEGMMRAEQSKKKADKGKIAEYQAQIQGINQSIASLKEGIIKDVLQTDLVDAASKVGDALVDAFGRGEDSVKSLENAANDMIKNLLRNQLNLALQNKMKPILDSLLSASGFNQDGSGTFTGLTPEQIAAFKAQVVAAGQSMQGFLEGYSEIFGGIDENAQGLKGDIKGITEKTAGALESQINAMRINQVSSLEVVRNSLLQLVAIESNTRNLIQIRQDIAEMNGKMTKGLAGI